MLTCDQALELMSAKLDGAITAEELPILEAHIATCPTCAQLDRDLTEIHSLTADMMVEPPAFIKENIMAQIAPKATKKVIPFPMIARRSMGFVAVVALVFLGGRVLFNGSNGSDSASYVSDSSSSTSTSSSSFSSSVTSGTDGSTFTPEDEPMMAVVPETESAERAVEEFEWESDSTTTAVTTESDVMDEYGPEAQAAFACLVDYLGGEEMFPDGTYVLEDATTRLGQRSDSECYTAIDYLGIAPEGEFIFGEYNFADEQYSLTTLEKATYWRVATDGTVTLEEYESE